MKKRGQGLSVNAIILIILAVVVLAVLIVGFTMGWDKIAPWLSSDNVESIKTQCSVACSTSNVYDYCTKERGLKVDGEKVATTTCNVFGNDDDYAIYGIAGCPELCEEKIYFWVADISKCTDTGQKIIGAGMDEYSNCDLDTKPTAGSCCEA